MPQNVTLIKSKYSRLRKAGLTVALVLLLPMFLSACNSASAGAHDTVWRPLPCSLGQGTDRARVVTEPRDGVRPLTRLLDQAQSSIFVEAYILTDRRIVRALERAVAMGVHVFVLLEPHPFGMGSQPQRMADLLRSTGAKVRWSPPAFALTHAKILVIDDRLAVISTANFSRSAYSRNREFVILDPVRRDVYDLSNLFRHDWNQLLYDPANPDLSVSPTDSRSCITHLVRRAHRSINMYEEELADSATERELARAAQHGARVRVLVPSSVSPAAVATLAAGGVEVRTLASPYIHAKSIAIDGKFALVGSVNISSASLDRNREVSVLLRGGSVRALERFFEVDWNRGAIVNPPLAGLVSGVGDHEPIN